MEREELKKEIQKYCTKQGYTWKANDIIEEFQNKYSKGFYVSHTCKEVIEHFKKKLETLERSAEDNIFTVMLNKIKESEHGYYLAWWLRLDFDNKYSTTKINYELSKAVKKGLLVSKSNKYGVEYRLA